MGYRPSFNNPFESFGRGLQQAGQRVATYFSQKAQENFQLGVREITQAEEAKAEIAARRANPDFAPSPEVSAALNSLYSYYDEIANMSPYQAREYVANNPPPQGVSVRTIAGKPPTPAGGANRQQGGPTPPQPGTPDSREVSPVPAGQFLGNIDRETARRARTRTETREEDVLRLQAELETAVNTAGIDAETAARIRIEDLQRVHDLVLQGKQVEAQRELAALENSYRLQEGQMQFIYDEMAAANAFERALTADELIRQEDRLEARLTAYRDDPGNPVARGALESIANNTRLPEWMRSTARTALDADTGEAEAAWLAGQRRVLEENRAGAEIAPLEVERAQQMVDLGEQELIVGGQQIALNQLDLTGESLRQARELFEFDMLKIDSAQEYIERAISLGMPEHINTLEMARTDTTHPLHQIAKDLTPAQISQALDMATDAHNLTDRQTDLLDAQIGEALSTIGTDAVVRTNDLVSSIGMTYEPDQILGLAESNPRIKTLIENGLLTRGDLLAAQAQANFRKSLENDQVNGRRVELAMDSLNTYANPTNFLSEENYEEDWQTATTGLTAVLNDLVRMGYMDSSQVEGLVTSFQAGWRNGANSYEMDKALNDAQIAAYRAQAANAGNGDGAGDTGYDDAQIRAVTAMHTARLDAIREANPNCFDPESGIPIGGDGCEESQAEYAVAKGQFTDFVGDVMGYLPDLSEVGGMSQAGLLGYADYLLRVKDPRTWTPQEEMVYQALAATYPGGESGMLDALGVPTSEPEEEPEQPQGPGFFGSVFGPAPGFGGRPREGLGTNESLPTPPASLGGAISAIANGNAQWGDDNYTTVLGWLNANGVDTRDSAAVRAAIDELVAGAGQ